MRGVMKRSTDVSEKTFGTRALLFLHSLIITLCSAAGSVCGGQFLASNFLSDSNYSLSFLSVTEIDASKVL